MYKISLAIMIAILIVILCVKEDHKFDSPKQEQKQEQKIEFEVQAPSLEEIAIVPPAPPVEQKVEVIEIKQPEVLKQIPKTVQLKVKQEIPRNKDDKKIEQLENEKTNLLKEINKLSENYRICQEDIVEFRRQQMEIKQRYDRQRKIEHLRSQRNRGYAVGTFNGESTHKIDRDAQIVNSNFNRTLNLANSLEGKVIDLRYKIEELDRKIMAIKNSKN